MIRASQDSCLRVRDLKEGDIAEIAGHVIYVHRKALDRNLEAVSLSIKGHHWELADCTILVVKVYKSGDTLEVC